MTNEAEAEDRAVVFDLDGTVWHVGHRIDWDNPATMPQHCKVRPAVVKRLRGLALAGDAGGRVQLAALTSRRANLHADVTEAQLRDALGADVAEQVPLLLSSHPIHTAMDMVIHKLDRLRSLQALGWKRITYVGDMEADKTAATAAGCRFMHVDDFADGQPLHVDGVPLREEEPRVA